MPKRDVRRKLRRVTILYWALLIYIVAALVWWFISLERQNDEMRDLRIARLRVSIDSLSSAAVYNVHVREIQKDHRRNNAKYYGEGSIFLLLILVGAVLVYRSVRRRFYL